MNEQTWILGGIALAGLTALVPAWRLSHRLFFASRYPALSIVLTLALTLLLAAVTFYVPFWLSQGQSVEPLHTLIDLLLYGAFPLGAVAMVAYVLDHLHERATMILIACSACYALALLPIAYILFADSMHTHFDIIPQSPIATFEVALFLKPEA